MDYSRTLATGLPKSKTAGGDEIPQCDYRGFSAVGQSTGGLPAA